MSGTMRLRKFSPNDRELPIYEIVAGDDVFFDVGLSDSGEYEFGAHPTSTGQVVSLEELLRLIEEARALLAAENAARG